jgi:hypothetical protein
MLILNPKMTEHTLAPVVDRPSQRVGLTELLAGADTAANEQATVIAPAARERGVCVYRWAA